MTITVRSCWWIERDHEELKQELGLGHYGSLWGSQPAWFPSSRGPVYCGQRLSGSRAAAERKKTLVDSQNLPYPKISRHGVQGPIKRHDPTSFASRLARLVLVSLL